MFENPLAVFNSIMSANEARLVSDASDERDRLKAKELLPGVLKMVDHEIYSAASKGFRSITLHHEDFLDCAPDMTLAVYEHLANDLAKGLSSRGYISEYMWEGINIRWKKKGQ